LSERGDAETDGIGARAGNVHRVLQPLARAHPSDDEAAGRARRDIDAGLAVVAALVRGRIIVICDALAAVVEIFDLNHPRNRRGRARIRSRSRRWWWWWWWWWRRRRSARGRLRDDRVVVRDRSRRAPHVARGAQDDLVDL